MQVSAATATVAVAPPVRAGNAPAEEVRRTEPQAATEGKTDDTAASEAKASEPRTPENDPGLRAELTRLQNRDREVRAHEQAHLSTAGRWATTGPSYIYQAGPDGKRYAVGGEVGISTSPVPNDLEATIAKARQVRAAALAPARPSGQDLRIAAEASSMEQRAQQALARARREAEYRPDGQTAEAAPGALLSVVA